MLETLANKGLTSEQQEEYEDASEGIQAAYSELSYSNTEIIQVACLAPVNSLLLHCV